jgi:ribosome-binding factor A
MSEEQQSSQRRVHRVENEVRECIASLLIGSGGRVPLRGLVTLTRVQMPPDLKSARVYVSVLGGDEDREISINNLNKYAKIVQSHIAKELKLRFCPKLTFFLDAGLDKALKIEKILHDLELDRQSKKPSSVEEE